eukprot:gene29479-36541_t
MFTSELFLELLSFFAPHSIFSSVVDGNTPSSVVVSRVTFRRLEILLEIVRLCFTDRLRVLSPERISSNDSLKTDLTSILRTLLLIATDRRLNVNNASLTTTLHRATDAVYRCCCELDRLEVEQTDSSSDDVAKERAGHDRFFKASASQSGGDVGILSLLAEMVRKLAQNEVLTEHSLYKLCLAATSCDEAFVIFVCDVTLSTRYCSKVFAPPNGSKEEVKLSALWIMRSSSATRLGRVFLALSKLHMPALWEKEHNPWFYSLLLIVLITTRYSLSVWDADDRDDFVEGLQTFEGKYMQNFNQKVNELIETIVKDLERK